MNCYQVEQVQIPLTSIMWHSNDHPDTFANMSLTKYKYTRWYVHALVWARSLY